MKDAGAQSAMCAQQAAAAFSQLCTSFSSSEKCPRPALRARSEHPLPPSVAPQWPCHASNVQMRDAACKAVRLCGCNSEARPGGAI
eukprot:3946146-Prymnesium_polylepis.1